jgi:multidrug efflux pump
MRRAIGVAVFFGMLGVTAFGLVLTPVFYVVIQRFVEGRELKKSTAGAGLSPRASVEA